MPDNPPRPEPDLIERTATSMYYLRTGQPWSKIIAAFLAGVLVGLGIS